MKEKQIIQIALIVFFTSIFCIGTNSIQAQNLDSLWSVWQDEKLADTLRLKAIDDLIMKEYVFSLPDSAFALAQMAYDYADSVGNKKYMATFFNTLGISCAMLGNYPRATDYFLKSKNIYEEIGNKSGLPGVLNNLASLYDRIGEQDKALKIYKEGLAILTEIGDEKRMIYPLINVGYNYATANNLDSAMKYFEHALRLGEKYDFSPGKLNSISGIGLIYELKNDHSNALKYYLESLEISKKNGPELSTVEMLTSVGKTYQELNETNKSITYCQEALERAEKSHSIISQTEACKCLYVAYKSLGENKKALEYHEQLTVLKDSVFNEENTQEITRLEMQYEFDKKETLSKAKQDIKNAVAAQEIKKKKLERNGFMAGFGVVLIFAIIFLIQRNKIGKEKQRSDELLLNILPEETAIELKMNGSAEAKLIEDTTVLFTDFEGFTAVSQNVTPSELVKDINECFSAFDHIMEKHGVEKIKTIGDAYMAAGGLPTPNSTHVKDVVLAALEIAEFMKQWMNKKEQLGEPNFNIRIGVNTGPVVAGIVGVKKFQYDIWGDTVNTASRAESASEVGKVNITSSTYELIKGDPQFDFVRRGKIKAKGKGEIEMYFVSRSFSEG